MPGGLYLRLRRIDIGCIRTGMRCDAGRAGYTGKEMADKSLTRALITLSLRFNIVSPF